MINFGQYFNMQYKFSDYEHLPSRVIAMISPFHLTPITDKYLSSSFFILIYWKTIVYFYYKYQKNKETWSLSSRRLFIIFQLIVSNLWAKYNNKMIQKGSK